MEGKLYLEEDRAYMTYRTDVTYKERLMGRILNEKRVGFYGE
jgi:hypothetical protein